MTPQEMKAGKARVLDHLIRPLDELMGYRRPKKLKTNIAHVSALAEMQKRLAYLTVEELLILRDVIIDAAPEGVEWPPVAVVLTWARSIRRPPDVDTGRVVRLTQWAAGKEDFPDWALPAFYRWVSTPGKSGQPNDFVLREICQQAKDDIRYFDLIAEREGRGGILASFEANRRDQIARDRERVKLVLAVDARELA